MACRKGWLVRKGWRQVPKCDFHETFSPIVKPATIHTTLFIVVTKMWPLWQVDVNKAFLSCDLTDELYMQQPLDYVQTDENRQPFLCLLNKALYFCTKLQEHGLISWRFSLIYWFQTLQIRCILVCSYYKFSWIHVLVYVDDIITTGNFSLNIDIFVSQLHTEFSLKIWGFFTVSWVLRWHVFQTIDFIFVSENIFLTC